MSDLTPKGNGLEDNRYMTPGAKHGEYPFPPETGFQPPSLEKFPVDDGTIILPHRFIPRIYQDSFLGHLEEHGIKRSIAIWHRRAGKDKMAWNYMIAKAHETIGVYYYFFPTYKQGKKALWDGIDNDGMPYLAHIPRELIWSTNDQEMKIKLVNGSLIQIVGTNDIDAIMSTNPRGCVFSEYSLQHPNAWEFVRPILLVNGGWAMFVYTPRGKNLGWELYAMAKTNPEWHVSVLTVNDTGIVSPEDIQRERNEGVPEEHIQQEYFCSFEAGMVGAYYSRILENADKEDRVTKVPHDPALKVHTAWDLGVGDSTAIWFFQVHGKSIRLVDYYETCGEGLPHYAAELRKRPYTYGYHFAPHDIQVRDISTGVSRWETARTLGIMFRMVPKLALDDGINAVRMVIPRCWFDRDKVKRGLAALMAYRKTYNELTKQYSSTPVHDWASNGADAFRMLAVAVTGVLEEGQHVTKDDIDTPYRTEYDTYHNDTVFGDVIQVRSDDWPF